MKAFGDSLVLALNSSAGCTGCEGDFYPHNSSKSGVLTNLSFFGPCFFELMKTIVIAALSSSIMIAGYDRTTTTSGQAALGGTDYQAVERSADETVWQRTVIENDPNGIQHPHINQVVELATRLNHKFNWQWGNELKSPEARVNAILARASGRLGFGSI